VLASRLCGGASVPAGQRRPQRAARLSPDSGSRVYAGAQVLPVFAARHKWKKAEDKHEHGDDYNSGQQILVPESSNHQTSATQLKTLDPEER